MNTALISVDWVSQVCHFLHFQFFPLFYVQPLLPVSPVSPGHSPPALTLYSCSSSFILCSQYSSRPFPQQAARSLLEWMLVLQHPASTMFSVFQMDLACVLVLQYVGYWSRVSVVYLLNFLFCRSCHICPVSLCLGSCHVRL